MLKPEILKRLSSPIMIGKLAEFKGVHINTVQRWIKCNHKKLSQPDSLHFLSKRLKLKPIDIIVPDSVDLGLDD
jgi:hypothetical protein